MKSFGEMRRIANNRGIAVILIAGIMLLFLLLFFVVGIEFVRLYYIRGELQNAADSAALAGSQKMTNPADLVQSDARIAARDFALRNKAAGLDVTLQNNGTDQTWPASTDNDIAIGFWSEAPMTCPLAEDPPHFCPGGITVTDSTGTHPFVNAIKVLPQRASGLEEARGPVDFLFKGLGNLVGWNGMDIRRQAIAAKVPKADNYIALCVSGCTTSLNLPRSIQPGPCSGSSSTCYDAAGNDIACTSCFDTNGNAVACDSCCTDTVGCTTCYNGSTPVACPGSSTLAWTSLLTNPTSSSGLSALVCGNQQTQEVCGQQIYTNMGTIANNWGDFKSLMFNTSYDTGNKICEDAGGTIVPCTSSAYSVKYWTIMIPITDKCPPGATGSWDPKDVYGYATIRLAAVCSPGGAGGCPGKSFHVNAAYPSLCPGGNSGVVVDQISCVSCAEGPAALGLKASLVK
jgi:Flp pilus assembly protein TadG